MRCELVAIAALAGCAISDPARPIGLVADDNLSEDDAADLAEAARCWNLRFGTQLVVGADARGADQRVDVFYDRHTCLAGAGGQVQAGWPMSLGLCPAWFRDNPLSKDMMFRVLTHELGHVLNIVGHPSYQGWPHAVMRDGGDEFQDMFSEVDVSMFRYANPDFEIRAVGHVARAFRPPARFNDRRPACALEAERVVLRDPLVVAAPFGVSLEDASHLAAAATCWNLRFGTQVVVRAPAPGESVAYIDYASCRLPGARCRLGDGNALIVGIDWAELRRTGEYRRQVGAILGLDGDPLVLVDVARLSTMHPELTVQCADVRQSGPLDACTCVDPPPPPPPV